MLFILENRAWYKTFRLHPHYFHGPILTPGLWHPAGSVVLPGAVLLEDDSSKLRVGCEELLVISFEQRWMLSGN